MPVTIRTLLAETDLDLVLSVDAGNLDHEVRWVAVSELPDPSPWMQGAELLLTSGMWLTEVSDRAAAAEQWAHGLAEAGTTAVGFGLRPWFEEVPPEVLAAVRRHRLTLLAVESDTPFVAIDRRVADLHAAEARQREAVVVRSQHRLVAAARDGAAAVTSALAKELPGWVVLLDAAHEVADEAGDTEAIDLDHVRAQAEVAAAQASHSLMAGSSDRPFYLVPLGTPENRFGTLCVDAREITAHGGQRARLVDTAAAIASVLSAHPAGTVGDVVVRLLLDHQLDAARRVCAAARIPLPDTLRAVCLGGRQQQEVVTRARALGMWTASSGPHRGTVVLGSPKLVDTRLADLLGSTGVRAGLSEPCTPEHVGRAIQEAAHALRLASADRPTVHYRGSGTRGLAAVLDADATRSFAHALLLPLQSHPEGDALLASARAWMHAQGRWDPAAAALGIHRATLRNRMKRLAAVLQVDLDAPADRLALAIALEAEGG